jgi:hypothetical protein
MLMLFGILSGLALGGCALAPEGDPSAVTAASKDLTTGETSAATTAPDATTNPLIFCPILPPDCCIIRIVSGCRVCETVCET